jgi:hypothetical protein
MRERTFSVGRFLPTKKVCAIGANSTAQSAVCGKQRQNSIIGGLFELEMPENARQC